MVRGYDVLFKDRLLGVLLVASALLLVIALCAWGSFYFKRMVKRDQERKKAFRNSHQVDNSDNSSN